MATTGRSSDPRPEPNVFRVGGISYLRIPAPDPVALASFYRDVFGWEVRDDARHPAFTDGTGHVIGHFRSDLAVVGRAGVLPYVYVADLDTALQRVIDHGGTIADQPYPEGNLWVATARDPAGNVLGLWQSGQRS